MKLSEKKCVPCEGGIPKLTTVELAHLAPQLPSGWEIHDNAKLTKTFHFVNFKHTMTFVNAVATIAEAEGHHPNMHVSYANVDISIWTHAINGLSENDFILAAKISNLNI